MNPRVLMRLAALPLFMAGGAVYVWFHSWLGLVLFAVAGALTDISRSGRKPQAGTVLRAVAGWLLFAVACALLFLICPFSGPQGFSVHRDEWPLVAAWFGGTLGMAGIVVRRIVLWRRKAVRP